MNKYLSTMMFVMSCSEKVVRTWSSYIQSVLDETWNCLHRTWGLHQSHCKAQQWQTFSDVFVWTAQFSWCQ